MDLTGPGPLVGWMNSSSCASQPVRVSGAKLGIAVFWPCVGTLVVTMAAPMLPAKTPTRKLRSKFMERYPSISRAYCVCYAQGKCEENNMRLVLQGLVALIAGVTVNAPSG